MVHDTEPVDIMREPSIVTAQRNSTCALRHLIVISLARWQTCNSTASGGGYYRDPVVAGCENFQTSDTSDGGMSSGGGDRGIGYA